MQTQTARDHLRQCAHGAEPAAWESFVERYGPTIEAGVRRALRRSAARRGHGPDRAAQLEDLVQECYCRLLEGGGRRLAEFRGLTEPEARAWLLRVAERSTRDRLRSARAEKRGGARTAAPWREVDRLRDRSGSPERRAIGRQELARFRRRLRRLSRTPRDERILRLVFLGGLTSREVARLSGGALSPSTIDTVVHRFRERLAAEGIAVARRSNRATIRA